MACIALALAQEDPCHTDNPFSPPYSTGREQRIRTRQAIDTYPGSCKEQGDK
jgi:hypothetical protein